jgi:two-component system, OmpR family, response regulator MprA
MNSSLARRTGRLLIVDDDEGVTQTFAGILRLEGHQVRTASNAFEGLKEVESFRPDAIILDLRMPLINGLGFLYRLRGFVETCRVPVAMITGDGTIDEEATNELRALGAILWMKPLWTEDLISIANALLANQTH